MRLSVTSNSTRTFGLYPALVLAEQALSRRRVHPAWLPVMGAGFALYKLVGRLPDRPGRRAARDVAGHARAGHRHRPLRDHAATRCTWATWSSSADWRC